MKKRSYQQNCALARAADVLGERWTVLIFRELLIQPCRYKELGHYLPGIGTNLLAQRLQELETFGLIEKANPEDKRSEYQLTPTGWSVEPVILSLVRWGFSHTESADHRRHFDHWDLLAMKSLFSRDVCKARVTVQFVSEALTAWCIVDPDQGCEIGVGELEEADIVYPGTVQDLYSDVTAGKVAKPPALRRFSACFILA